MEGDGNNGLRSPVLGAEAPRGTGAVAVMEDHCLTPGSAQAVPRGVPQLGSEEESSTLQKAAGMAPVR